MDLQLTHFNCLPNMDKPGTRVERYFIGYLYCMCIYIYIICTMYIYNCTIMCIYIYYIEHYRTTLVLCGICPSAWAWKPAVCTIIPCTITAEHRSPISVGAANWYVEWIYTYIYMVPPKKTPNIILKTGIYSVLIKPFGIYVLGGNIWG